MWCRIFTALLLAHLTSVFLLSVGRSAITDDNFASAVGTMNGCGDHGLFRLSNSFCLYFTTPFPSPPLPASSGSGASHAASSRIIITGATLSRCWQMPERTSRRSPIPLMTCFVILAVLLRLTSVLPSHRSMPHNQLGSI